MKRLFWSCCIVLIGTFLAPCFSFSMGMDMKDMEMSKGLDAPHNPSYSPDFGCYSCHEEGVSFRLSGPECIECHINDTGGNYSDNSAPKMANHSSVVIGSDKYEPWERKCRDCHEQHVHNRNEGSNNVVEIVVGGFETVDHETTLSLTSVNVLEPDWTDPATWGAKTGPERGLILERKTTTKDYTYEILSATADTITVRNGKDDGFTSGETLYIKYGMYIAEQVGGNTVIFTDPRSMANDETGTGTDTTPDGICQVCHTQTTHWRNDGSFANHFSGWNCTMCHPHEEGFKANPPSLCP